MRTCTARVTVVVLCLCVCLSVCMYVCLCRCDSGSHMQVKNDTFMLSVELGAIKCLFLSGSKVRALYLLTQDGLFILMCSSGNPLKHSCFPGVLRSMNNVLVYFQ